MESTTDLVHSSDDSDNNNSDVQMAFDTFSPSITNLQLGTNHNTRNTTRQQYSNAATFSSFDDPADDAIYSTGNNNNNTHGNRRTRDSLMRLAHVREFNAMHAIIGDCMGQQQQLQQQQ